MTWKEMLKIVHKYLGVPDKKIITIPNWMYALGGKKIMKEQAQKGIQGGLHMVKFTDIMCSNLFIDKSEGCDFLGVTIAPGEIYMEVDHVYPDITIHLTLFRAAIVSGRPQKLEHADIRFIPPSDIPRYAFCPADGAILERIVLQGL